MFSEEYRFPVSTQSVRCVVHTRATIHALSKDRKLSVCQHLNSTRALQVYTVGSNPKLLGVSKQFDSEPTRFDLYKGVVASFVSRVLQVMSSWAAVMAR